MTLKLYSNIPWDNAYNHTVDFRDSNNGFSSSVRNSYFASHLYSDESLEDSAILFDSQQYIIGKPQIELISNGINYCIFNMPESTKTFYAFITDIEYYNKDASIVRFEIDVMQTYMSEIISGNYQNYIARHHHDRWISGSIPNLNTIPDVVEKTISNYTSIEKIDVSNGKDGLMYVLVYTTDWISGIEKPQNASEKDLTAEFINGTPFPLYCYVFPFHPENSNSKNAFFVRNGGGNILPISGIDLLLGAANIIDVFICDFLPTPPSVEMNEASNSVTYTFDVSEMTDTGESYANKGFFCAKAENSNNYVMYISSHYFGDAQSKSHISSMPNVPSYDIYRGHTAFTGNQNSSRNIFNETKLYTSQYTTVNITNFQNTVVLEPQHIPFGTGVIIQGRAALSGIPSFVYEFPTYNGGGIFRNSLVDSSPRDLPYATSQYYETLSRSKASFWGGPALNTLHNIYGGVSTSGQTSIIDSAVALKSSIDKSAFQVAADMQSKKDLFTAPLIANNVVSGGAGHVSLERYGLAYWIEYAENENELADFWNAYGYPTERFYKISEIISTRYWHNYIETKSSCFPNIGNLEHRKKIEKIFDSGITFWHDRNGVYKDIGDYSKENAELSLIG